MPPLFPPHTPISLANFYAETQKKGTPLKTIHPLPVPIRQKGNTCMLVALWNSLQWFRCQVPSAFENQPLPPLYKSSTKTRGTTSFRQIAKAEFDSVVGDIYSPLQLTAMAKKYGANAKVIHPTNYIETLKHSIDNHSATLVFFDVEVENRATVGAPISSQGKHMHGTLVVGYYPDEHGDTQFILANWGQYRAVSGKALAASAQQLPESVPKQSFVKTNKSPYHETRDARHQPYWEENTSPLYPKMRQQEQHKAYSDSFKNCIITLTHPDIRSHQGAELSYYQAMLNTTQQCQDFMFFKQDDGPSIQEDLRHIVSTKPSSKPSSVPPPLLSHYLSRRSTLWAFIKKIFGFGMGYDKRKAVKKAQKEIFEAKGDSSKILDILIKLDNWNETLEDKKSKGFLVKHKWKKSHKTDNVLKTEIKNELKKFTPK